MAEHWQTFSYQRAELNDNTNINLLNNKLFNYIDTYEILLEQKKLLKETLIKMDNLDEKAKLINNIVGVIILINNEIINLINDLDIDKNNKLEDTLDIKSDDS